MAEVQGQIVGFMIRREGTPAKIDFIAVHPNFQREGIGSELVNSISGTTTTWTLESSISFWRSLGFAKTDRWKEGDKRRVWMIKPGTQSKIEEYS